MTSSERAAVIAEKVMGWTLDGGDEFTVAWWVKNPNHHSAIPAHAYNPDHNIEQAMEALEKWREGDDKRSYEIESPMPYCKKYEAKLSTPDALVIREANTLPEAITNALIKWATSTKQHAARCPVCGKNKSDNQGQACDDCQNGMQRGRDLETQL